MDLSSMIFVAVAVAWALYLIPMFRRDDEASKSRSVDRFSDTMRVLAGRETPVDPAKGPQAQVSQAQASQARVAEPPSQAQIAARRAATRKATERRRRVLMVLAGLNVVVAALAAAAVVGWVWQSVPAALVVVWLVLCRVMVKGERAVTRSMFDPVEVPDADAVDDDLPAEYDVARNEQGFDEVAPEAETTTIPRITEELWDPVPVTLPTYVGKEKAVRRTVRTIDLGGPGAWTSGHDAEDTEIAREAEVVAATARDDENEQEQRRAVGE